MTNLLNNCILEKTIIKENILYFETVTILILKNIKISIG